MESCILCLEINKSFVDSIATNSKKWQEYQVAELIEKHFWPLVNISKIFLLSNVGIFFDDIICCIIIDYANYVVVKTWAGIQNCSRKF